MRPAEYQGDIAPDGALQPFRVAVRDGVSPEAVKMLEQTPNLTIVDPDDPSAQGMLIRSATKFQKPEDFDRFPQLSYVARVGVGVDNIGMGLASERGIATVNTPGASTEAVARRVVAFVHTWAARIVQGTQALREGTWPKGREDVEPLDLSEKTLGIVGYGRIGQAVRRQAESLFGEILYADVRPEVGGATDLTTLLEQSDVVSLNVAGNGQILTPEMFTHVKPESLIVNTARGGVIDHAALLEHLKRGGSAALDVFPKENQTLFDDTTMKGIIAHPNAIVTPHTAASDAVTQKNLAKEASTRMRQFAHFGAINPMDIAGHTLPKIEVQNGHPTPGIRAVVFHESVKGTLEAISGSAARQNVNIDAMSNAQGPNLAATIAHLETTDPQLALAVMREIEGKIRVLRARLLQFA